MKTVRPFRPQPCMQFLCVERSDTVLEYLMGMDAPYRDAGFAVYSIVSHFPTVIRRCRNHVAELVMMVD